MIRICEKCGGEYAKFPSCSMRTWAERKYCSKSCSNSVTSLGRKNGLGRTPWNKGISGPKGSLNPTWKGGEIALICLECGGSFSIKRYREKTAHFCSQDCAHANRNEGKTTRNDAMRRSAAGRAWRTLVFERDNYTCRECGIRGGRLHADHIKPMAFFPELAHDVSNGRTLCIPCHRKTPTFGRRAYQAAAEIIKLEIA